MTEQIGPDAWNTSHANRVAQKQFEQLKQQLANVTIMLTQVLAERDVLREDYDVLAKQNAALIAELATLKQPSV